MGFVFYDIETTGPDPYFDQVVRLAAIRTDFEFAELERFEAACRLQPHVVPSPSELVARGCLLDTLTDPTLGSHYEMGCAVAARFASWSPSVFIAWGSFRHQEEFVRQLLYQTLHKPYVTSDPNGRADVRKVAQIASANEPPALLVPIGDDGDLDYELASVATANGFNRRVVTALDKVEATIHLARILCEHASDPWSCAQQFSRKVAANAFLAEERAFLITECYFDQPYRYPLTVIGEDTGSPGALLAFNLRFDPNALRAMSDEALAARLKERPKPVRRVKANTGPHLQSIHDIGSDYDIPVETLFARADDVARDDVLRERLCRLAASPPYPRSSFVERQIYDRFFTPPDQELMATFHQLPWEERGGLVSSFEDERLRRLATRLLYYHCPSALPPRTLDRIEIAFAQRLLGDEDGHSECRTLEMAMREVEGLTKREIGEERVAIAAIRRHLDVETQRLSRSARAPRV